MDTHRALLAIVISFVIIFGYQYLFVKPQQSENDTTVETNSVPAPTTNQTPDYTVAGVSTSEAGSTATAESEVSGTVPAPVREAVPSRAVNKVNVDTDLFTASFSEAGAAIESFVLKKHRETNAKDSPGKQLFPNTRTGDGSVKFSWGKLVPADTVYTLKNDTVTFKDGKGELHFEAVTPAGLAIEKIYSFSKDSYLIDLQVKVKNTSGQVLQGSPELHQVNIPFKMANTKSRFAFEGAASYSAGQLEKVKSKKLAEGPQTRQGVFDWVAFESTYFLCAVVPESKSAETFVVEGTDKKVSSVMTGQADSIDSGAEAVYSYKLFYGPKKYSMLKEIGYNLDRSIDFGWFAIIARPTLWLLNFFHSYLGNYGIAIILVTVIYKSIFWPITQRGLKSMKNMQKLQPKMAKLKEKYKDDPQAMNREVMNLYRTYKVNPLGGCLPMLIQIPVFFALYKVLLICIELRHAPFMLWITDLSAPDRLWVGFDIPYLGGIPVLTLLMGASMFLQQKMSPTTADPSQQRMMMMLPVVFTFMFINFASGLVLYWFVNNLLSILQQQLINRSMAKKTA